MRCSGAVSGLVSDAAAALADQLRRTARTLCGTASRISHLEISLTEAVELAEGESEWVSSDAVPVDSHAATYTVLVFGSSLMIDSVYLPMCLPPTSFLYMKGMVVASVLI